MHPLVLFLGTPTVPGCSVSSAVLTARQLSRSDRPYETSFRGEGWDGEKAQKERAHQNYHHALRETYSHHHSSTRHVNHSGGSSEGGEREHVSSGGNPVKCDMIPRKKWRSRQ